MQSHAATLLPLTRQNSCRRGFPSLTLSLNLKNRSYYFNINLIHLAVARPTLIAHQDKLMSLHPRQGEPKLPLGAETRNTHRASAAQPCDMFCVIPVLQAFLEHACRMLEGFKVSLIKALFSPWEVPHRVLF